MIRTIHSAILTLALITSLSAKDWPTTFTPSPAIGKFQTLDPIGEVHRYATRNYLIESERPLDRAKLTSFAKTIESVAYVIKAIPLPLFAPPLKGRQTIQICSNEESYLREGGPIGTAGFYSGHHSRVLIRWDQLYPPNGNARPMDDLLVHELTHLCMTELLWKCPPWFHEGVAEYLAAAHIGSGQFRFTNIEQAIQDHIKKHLPPEAKSARALSPKTLLPFTTRDWQALTREAIEWQAFEPYTTSLLLVHYAFHGGAERRAKVKSYLEALAEINDRRAPRPMLFDSAEALNIQKMLTRFWSTRGLKLQFKK